MAIPKVIHFLWMSKEKDSKTLMCLETWKRELSGYEIKEWNADNFPYKDFEWTREAAEAKKWAYVTDFFRLWVVYNYGGIYMDADVMLNKNFDEFLDYKLFIGTEFTKQIGAHCFGAEAGNGYIKQCLDFYMGRHFKNEDGSLMILPIPRVMTYFLIKRYGFNGSLANFTDTPISFNNEISIFPDNYFTIDVSDGRNVGVHLGLGAWRSGEWIKEQPIYCENLQAYFIKRFYLSKISKPNPLKNFLYMLFPNFLMIGRLKKNLKVKNIKTITDIEYLE